MDRAGAIAHFDNASIGQLRSQHCPLQPAALGSEVVKETERQRKLCAFAGDLGKQVCSGRAPLVTLSHEPNLSVGPIAKGFVRRATTATEVGFLHTCNGAASARTELDITVYLQGTIL